MYSRAFFAAMAALSAPAPALAQQGYGPGNWGPHMMWGGGWFGGPFMIIIWIVVLLALVFGIRWAFRAGGGQGGQAGESALDVLKRRYAAGEIDRQQYLDMKRDLEG